MVFAWMFDPKLRTNKVAVIAGFAIKVPPAFTTLGVVGAQMRSPSVPANHEAMSAPTQLLGSSQRAGCLVVIACCIDVRGGPHNPTHLAAFACERCMPWTVWLVVVPQVANPRTVAFDTALRAHGHVGVKLAAVLVVVTPPLHVLSAATEPTPKASITGNDCELRTVPSASAIVVVSTQQHPILQTFDAAMFAEGDGKVGVATALRVMVIACVLDPALTADETAARACSDGEVAAKVTSLGMVRAAVGNHERPADHEATATPSERLSVSKRTSLGMVITSCADPGLRSESAALALVDHHGSETWARLCVMVTHMEDLRPTASNSTVWAHRCVLVKLATPVVVVSHLRQMGFVTTGTAT